MSTIRIYWREQTEEGQWVSEWGDVTSYSYTAYPGCLLFATTTSRNVIPMDRVQQIQHTGELQ